VIRRWRRLAAWADAHPVALWLIFCAVLLAGAGVLAWATMPASTAVLCRMS
jgi:hypothetical protein